MRAAHVDPGRPAPAWDVAEWLNTAEPLALEQLRGRVVVLHAFQMLCPGCVIHGVPQAQRIQQHFAAADVAVVGLHSVFEHHDAMRPASLRAFLHEFRVTFPVGVDAHDGANPEPRTMRAYRMRGTPTLVVIDRAGIIRYHAFGRPGDLEVGAAIGELLAQPGDHASADRGHATEATEPRCDDDGCTVR